MSELKPCVMCGGKYRDLMGYDYHKVSCSDDNCPLSYLALTKDEWNKRVETEEEIRLTAIATKHAMVNDERYELLENQKSDIEKMLDDVNHQLDKSRTEADK